MWIDPDPAPREEELHWRRRLADGLEHNIRLVIAKSVLGLQAASAEYRQSLRIGAEFGTTYSANGWGAAMSILTCTANIHPQLHEDDRPRPCTKGFATWPGSAQARRPGFRWNHCRPARPAPRYSPDGFETSSMSETMRRRAVPDYRDRARPFQGRHRWHAVRSRHRPHLHRRRSRG